jgi:two-component system, NarL family, sensor kinase
MLLMHRLFILFSFSAFIILKAEAQQTYADSLRNYIDTSHNKWEVTNNCMKLAEKLIPTDTVEAEKYLQKALAISKKRNDNSNIGHYYLLKGQKESNYANFKQSMLLADSSIFFFTKGISNEKDLKEKEKAILNRSSAYSLKASNFNSLGNNEEAINFYLTALVEWEKTTLPEKYHGMAVITSNIGGIYMSLGNLGKVLEYDKKGLTLMKKAQSPDKTSLERDIATFHMYISDDYLKLNKRDTADIYLDSSKAAVEKLNESGLWQKYLSRKALLLSKAGHDEEALIFYKRALTYAEINGNKSSQASIKKNIGDKLILLNRLAEGRVYLDAACKQADSLKQIASKGGYYLSYLNLESKSGNYKKAFEYSELLRKLNDSLNNKEMAGKVAEIEKKYDTQKKENKIVLQQAEIKQKSTLNYLLGGGAVAILLLSFIGYRNYSNKKKVQQLRITELETEKQLSATEAVLKGEEQERTRLAKDLHDGLGGMLSGIKYSFNNMKENLILTPDTAQAFSRSMDMLDNSIKEMRRVAHNMMPESLMRYGLDKTLQDYTAEINKSGMVTVAYQSMGMENKTVDNTTAITIYRIVQELLNNVTKHAAAKQVLVQLLAQGNKLVVNVEDDGKGFDTTIIERAEGIGWKNIQSRVEFLKGTLEVQSSDGKGTAVNMEFNI